MKAELPGTMRNLLALLLDSTAEELVRIARSWQVDLQGVDLHQDVSRLYRSMTDPWAFAIAWDSLSQGERIVFDVLSKSEDALPPSDIMRAIVAEQPGLTTEAETAKSVGRLTNAGWMFPDSPELSSLEAPPDRIFVPRELAHLRQRLAPFSTHGAPFGLAADELLDRLDDQELYEIALQLGFRVVPAVAARQDIVAFLAPRLGEPGSVRERLRMLDRAAAQLYAVLERRDGRAYPSEVLDELGLAVPALRRSIHSLANHALLWRGYDRAGRFELVVPEIVLHPRESPPPEYPALEFVDSAKVELPDWMPGYAIAWDLLSLLRDIAEGHGAWKRPGPERNLPTLRRLGKRFWFGQASGNELPPTGYLPFLLLLADSLGLTNPEHAEIVGDSLRDWTRRAFPEQMSRLEAIWRSSANWPEGVGFESLRVWGARWPEFRQTLLDSLSAVEPSGWVTVDSFAERFAVGNPNALGSQFIAAGGHEQGEESADARRRAVIHQAAALTVTTACQWLGLVRVAKTRGRERQVVFQVSDLRSWQSAEQRGGEGSPATSRPLAVQPDFTVLLTQPSPRRIWALTAFSEPEPLDRVTNYRISRASLQQGLSTGLSLGRIVRFLEDESGAPLPQNVAFELGEWAHAYRRVRLRHAIVVEPDDRNSLATIERALREEGGRVERIGPQRLLVIPAPGDPGLAERLEERLRALGQAPQWIGQG